MPEHIVFILHAVGILLGYGRHLLGTVRQRAAAPTFPTIAACFGTANLTFILAHLNRGILRAAAPERFLLARAATGRDIDIPAPAFARRNHHSRQRTLKPSHQRTSQPGPKPSHVRRCRDLQRSRRCARPLHRRLWNHLYEIMHYLGGDVGAVMREKNRREQKFIQEQDSTWDWLQLKPDEIRQVLGLLHRRTTGRSIRPCRGAGHRPALTHRRMTLHRQPGAEQRSAPSP
jgi:hypothetical protein